MDKKLELDNIKHEIIENNVCAELAKTAKNLVIGEGSLDARVVFVGEAPGAREDETGKPFQGAAGRNLDEQLMRIGLSREQVFITNPVMYRPPKNRDPKQSELDEFRPYFERIINLIDPELVVPLGRVSMARFIKNEKTIAENHGKIFEVDFAGKQRKIMPVYHPSPLALNTNPQNKANFISDFDRICIDFL